MRIVVNIKIKLVLVVVIVVFGFFLFRNIYLSILNYKKKIVYIK